MRSGIEKRYTDRDLKLIEELKKKYTYSQIGTIFGRSKNSVIGAMYRHKLKKGHQAVKDVKPKKRKAEYEKTIQYYDTHQRSS